MQTTKAFQEEGTNQSVQTLRKSFRKRVLTKVCIHMRKDHVRGCSSCTGLTPVLAEWPRSHPAHDKATKTDRLLQHGRARLLQPFPWCCPGPLIVSQPSIPEVMSSRCPLQICVSATADVHSEEVCVWWL